MAVSSDKSDEKVERVVLSPEILETGHEGFHYLLILVCSKFIWILQMNFFALYHPLYIVDFTFLLKYPKGQYQTVLKRGVMNSLVSDVFFNMSLSLRTNNLE